VTAARLVIGLNFQFRLFVIDRFVQLLIFMVSLLGELLDLTGFDSVACCGLVTKGNEGQYNVLTLSHIHQL
jgi:hypothetical protein